MEIQGLPWPLIFAQLWLAVTAQGVLYLSYHRTSQAARGHLSESKRDLGQQSHQAAHRPSPSCTSWSDDGSPCMVFMTQMKRMA
jgi:hypothetical protein